MSSVFALVNWPTLCWICLAIVLLIAYAVLDDRWRNRRKAIVEEMSKGVRFITSGEGITGLWNGQVDLPDHVDALPGLDIICPLAKKKPFLIVQMRRKDFLDSGQTTAGLGGETPVPIKKAERVSTGWRFYFHTPIKARSIDLGYEIVIEIFDEHSSPHTKKTRLWQPRQHV